MDRQWTFGQKIAAGFAAVILLFLAINLVSYSNLGTLNENQRWVDHTHSVIEEAIGLLSSLKDAETGQRGYLVTGREDYLAPYNDAQTTIFKHLDTIQELTADNPRQQKRIEETRVLIAAKLAELKQTIELRRDVSLDAALKIVLSDQGKTVMDEIRTKVAEIQKDESDLLAKRSVDSAASEKRTNNVLLFGSLGILTLAIIIAFQITRTLSRQIGTAIQHIQTSSTQLQSACSEQATSSTEQRSTITETATTLKELAATSRQMLESAQRVTKIADETAGSARVGDTTVQRAQDSILGIKRQVELIVGHMLDLGKKSQQVGGVLELINELAEQTNILAINATIESAGAGEAGKRFAVVADEIRKLADRVAGSTKEIRTLIEEIRSAANTTVMATEDGAKAVDAGTRQFNEVATAFRGIAERVQTTTDASREIELGTKQQVTAVEQVNAALQGIVQAASQNESSTKQTLETVTQLSALSKSLSALVQSAKAA